MQNLFKIILIIVVSFFSQNTFAEDSSVEDLNSISVYVSGTVVDINTDENNFKNYITELKDGSVIDVNTYGIEVPIGSKIHLEYFLEQDYYNFININRNFPIALIFVIFIASILILAKRKGLRSLGSLGLSMFLLFFVLTPMLLSGFDPIWTTVIFGLFVLFLSIFVTHGFNRQSLVSFLGSFSSLILAIVLLALVTKITHLTGFINDEIQFLSSEVGDSINLVRLVSASIIIGILGVLDDITITQVAVVRELSTSGISRKNIFIKALRVGRDHISSLVNTLVFAYVGATLPMIMYISLLEIPFFVLISQEFIFIEIMRSLIGAIALTLAVPITTWMATYIFLDSIKKDAHSIESACAHHSH
ncbi:MAG: YibE/F family protein [Candidatus Pacebacteria bacterium]|nr:YibE/F family protein [Candidatus Paceibacterota bacterium]